MSDHKPIRTPADCDHAVEEIKGLLGDPRPEAQARFERLLGALQEYLAATPAVH